MTKEREALKLALEALMNRHSLIPAHIDQCLNAIAAIKKVLEQPPEERNFCPRCGKRAGKNAWDVHTCSLPEPEQDPVRIMGFNCMCGRRTEVIAEQVVAPAPQRTWVGLTDEEREELMDTYDVASTDYARAIEAKLKEKNCG